MKKIYFSHNVCLNSEYDFNIIKEILKKDYIIVDDIKKADTCIYAGCGSRGVWVDDAINEINKIIEKNRNINIITTGCFIAIEPKKIKKFIKTNKLKMLNFNEIVKQYSNKDLNELDNDINQFQNYNLENNKKKGRLNKEKQEIVNFLELLDKKYNSNFTDFYKQTTKGFVFYDKNIANITLTRGCPYKCSYCSIPLGRGKYNSIPLGNIIEKIEYNLKEGINEFLFLGDELGNYGLGTNNDLSKLLDFILSKYDIKISLRYIEPQPFLKHFNTIEKFSKKGKIKLLYIPIQSGSNKILQLMNRPYKIDTNFINKIISLKDKNVILYTNWMVGFPNETIQDIEETKKLMEILNCNINVIVPFSKRPNTPAEKMTQISIKEKEKRYYYLLKTAIELKKRNFELLLNKFNVTKKEKEQLFSMIQNSEMKQTKID